MINDLYRKDNISEKYAIYVLIYLFQYIIQQRRFDINIKDCLLGSFIYNLLKIVL